MELSLIIAVDENCLNEYIDILKPLVSLFETEVIIINNQKDSFDLQFKSSVYKYTEDYSNFRKFCFDSSLGKRVIIIEKGFILSPEFINQIMGAIESEDHSNISNNLITYLSEDEVHFFIKEEVFVHCRGVTGFSKKLDITVKDYSLIWANEFEIDAGIKKLLNNQNFYELYIWYKHFVVKKSIDYQLKFYALLERAKRNLEDMDVLKLENIFLDSLINNKYTEYLKIKKILRENSIEGVSKIAQKIQRFELIENEIYYSWLIMDCIQANIIPCFINYMDEGSRVIWFNWLFVQDCETSRHFYQFIIKMCEKKDELVALLNIMTSYINNEMGQLKEFSKTDKLLQVFELYLEYATVLLQKNVAEEVIVKQTRFINSVREAKELIRDNQVQEGIAILEKICYEHPSQMIIAQLYLQKARHEFECYPYVVSICMIIKNEEKNLDRCLLSLKPLVDLGLAEIIIVDTGSTDKSIEIAKRYTNKLYSFEWTGDFSEARNRSLLYAKGKYIFIMDADEELKDDAISKLISIFTSSDYEQYNTFSLKILSYTNIDYTQFSAMTQQRIFRNNGEFYYESAIHNQPEFKPPFLNLDIEIIHYGYIMTPDIRDKKFIRTTSLLKKELEKDPRNIYYRYQLSSSYAMHNDLGEALRQVDIFMRLIREKREVVTAALMFYNNAVAIYLAGHRYSDAERIIDEALSSSPDFIDFIYYKINLLFRKEQYKAALEYIERYLAIVDDYLKSETANNAVYAFYTISNKHLVLRLYVVSNYRLGQYEKCLEKFNMIKDDNTLKNCLHEIIAAFFYTKKYEELAGFYKIKIEVHIDKHIKDIFGYFLLDHINDISEEAIPKCLSSLIIEARKNVFDSLDLISNYEINIMDLKSAYSIFSKLLPILKTFSVLEHSDADEINKMRKAARAILHHTEGFIRSNLIGANELFEILDQYLSLSLRLIEMQRIEFFEEKELFFVSKITVAFNLMTNQYNTALQYFQDAKMNDIEMSGIVSLIIDNYLSGMKVNHVENKCKARIKHPEISKTCMHPIKLDDKSIKVLHGSMDLTHKTIELVKALNKHDVTASVLNYLPDYSDKTSEFELDITTIDNDKLLTTTSDCAARLIPRFDVFHFHYLSSLTLDYSDLIMLKELNKKIFMHCWGQDVRQYSIAHKLNPYLPKLSENDHNIKHSLELISKHIPNCIISDYELHAYVKDYFPNIKQVNRMLDLKQFTMYPYRQNRQFTIVHTPTVPQLQGSTIILGVIEKLKLKYDIDFKLVQDMSREKSLRIYENADLIIDQLLLGCLCQFSIEAMALGKPVICYITDFMKENYPKELPIIVANPDDIEKRLEYVLDNRDMLKDLGIQGRRYVEKYHDVNCEILKLIELYKG